MSPVAPRQPALGQAAGGSWMVASTMRFRRCRCIHSCVGLLCVPVYAGSCCPARATVAGGACPQRLQGGCQQYSPRLCLPTHAAVAFRIYDLDNTGHIERGEVQRFLAALLKDNPAIALDDAQLDAIMDAVSAGGSWRSCWPSNGQRLTSSIFARLPRHCCSLPGATSGVRRLHADLPGGRPGRRWAHQP